MAKLKMLIAEISGSIGALTFRAHGNGGPAVYQKPHPSTKHRSSVQIGRSRLSYLSRKWQSLTSAQRRLWNDYALAHPVNNSLGTSINLSGYNWFLGLNARVLRATDPLIPSPPIAPCPASIATLVLTDGMSDGIITVTWTTHGVPDAADWVEIQASRALQGSGIDAYNDQWITQRMIAGDLTTGNSLVLGVGFNYWIRIRYQDINGQISPWVQDQHVAPDVP